jgi:hypothetical protein
MPREDWRAPIIDAEDAVRHADETGWDVDWAGMTPEQMVADMRRVVPPLALAAAFIENEALYALWAQWRIEKLKGDQP